MKRISLALALALGLAGAVTALSTAGSSPAPLAGPTGNLLSNPDAESGPGGTGSVKPIPGWTKSGGCGGNKSTVVRYGAPGGFPNFGSPGPSSRGLQFFAGGPTTCDTQIKQFVDLSPHAAAIDAKLAEFHLNGWFGGFKTQNDTAGIEVDYYNKNGTFISDWSTGYPDHNDRVGITGLGYFATSGFVPHTARSAWVIIFFNHHAGGYNDGYADNVDYDLLIHSAT